MANVGVDISSSEPETRPAGGDRAASVAVAAIPSSRQPPLCYSQERTWFLEQIYPGHARQRLVLGTIITGPLAHDALQTSAVRVIARHEVLHCRFGPDAQSASAEPTLSVDTLADVAASPVPEAARMRWIAQIGAVTLDPVRGPLLRLHLLRLDAEEHLLLVVAHRYVCDEESLAILVDEIARSIVGDLPADPATTPFADFVAWQRHDPRRPALLDHWRSQLADAPVLDLPTDRARPALQGCGGTTLTLHFPADLAERLRGLAARQGTTLEAVLLAAFAALLQRHSGQDDLVIGVRASYRNQPPFADVVGPLDNTLALRLNLSGDPDTDAMLRIASIALDDARAHSGLAFEQLIEVFAPGRNPGYAPICQVLFDYREAARSNRQLGRLRLQPVPIDLGSSAHDLHLRIDAGIDGIGARLIYDPDLFVDASVRRMADHYLTLLGDLADDVRKPVASLRLLTDAEWRQVVVAWNATEAEYPDETSLARLFEDQAKRSPEAPAVLGPGPALSYRELDERANRLANHLLRLGVGHETLVGVSMERCPELFVAVLAILKAGACYVPLDPNYPAQRLTAMMEDTGVGLILTKALWLDVLSRQQTRILCLDRDWPAVAAEPATPPRCPAGAASLAYVVFTSGSTGRPKGVLVEQRQLLNRFAWMWRQYPFAAGDVSACKTALNFVDSLWELLGPLLQGVPSVLVPQLTLLDPWAFVALLAEYRVSRMMLVPSLLRMMLDAHRDLDSRLPLLREWCIGGEALSVDLARRFSRAMPGRLLLNLYGLSETFDACFFDASQLSDDDSLVPIGRPLANVQAYVLDAHRQPVPIGVSGELHVGGAGLARCYLGPPKLSAERFIANPFVAAPDARIYRTGDLARLRPNGLIDYLGRCDNQVKIRGFRVEPDEVAAVLRGHSLIAHAAVVARADGSGEHALAAYIVPKEATPPSAATLRTWLRERLPDHMVPSTYTVLTTLPMTPSGKLDRLSLPVPEPRRASTEVHEAAPASATAQAIIGVWRDVLELDQVVGNDNFFDLGGDSLRMMDVIARLKANHGIVLNPREILFQTVAQLAAISAKRLAATATVAGPDFPAPTREPEPKRGGGLLRRLKRALLKQAKCSPDGG
jgi:amino acid adenylation domain-containing protein